jgi:hypothetical protein
VIGISVQDSQLPIVSEFFELFKTPWEVYEPGRLYDVAITTRIDGPFPNADMVITFAPVAIRTDEMLGIAPGQPVRAGRVDYQGVGVPIYGELLSFVPGGAQLAAVHGSGRVIGISMRQGNTTVMRIGYDLFEEVRVLLSSGQPLENAKIPSLDLHIDMLRTWIRQAGIGVVEIPPTPAGYPFSVCLTHDIDFVGIREHRFDHSMFGFLLRATFGVIGRVVRGRLTFSKLLGAWRAAATLPFVFLGWAPDFWEPFDWYLTVEKGLGATYFLIPFRGRAGSRHSGPTASRRATAYDVTTIPDAVRRLVDEGCEVGVHGIDAWHSTEAGRSERARVVNVSGGSDVGIRMHWLLHDENTPRVLDEAGYTYDSTGGYNETVGYLHGTTQVFRPLGAHRLLELPMHIQDGALFFPERLGLTERDAWTRCRDIISQAVARGGTVTVLWHDRSHAPERYWGDFYIRLVQDLRACGAWFATGGQLTAWFAARRSIRFERTGTGPDAQVQVRCEGAGAHPPFIVRVHHATAADSTFVDTPWTGAAPTFVAPGQRMTPGVSDDGVTLPHAAGGC